MRPPPCFAYAGKQAMEAEQRTGGRVAAAVVLALLALAAAARLTTSAAEHRKEAALAGLLAEAAGASAAQRNGQAARAYRKALQLDPGSFSARLGLARVLVHAEEWNEAQGQLNQLRTLDPASSQVNLLSARVAWQTGQLELASDYFHRAVYGYWPPEEMDGRPQARLLMVRLLALRKDRGALVPELLRLQRELPEDSPHRRETARLLLDAGMAAEAARELRLLLESHPDDVNLKLSLAEAELAQGNHITARTQLRALVRQHPEEEQAPRRLEMIEQVIALDPLLRGASLVERHRRSQLLLERTIRHAESCGTVDAVGEHLETAHREASEPYRRATAEAALERNLQTAEPLTHVFARLEREAR